MTTFRPAAEFGSVLTGRAVAADFRAEIERQLDLGEHVVVDFADVAMISPSFADELFAKMPSGAWGSTVRAEHLDGSIERFARFVIASRD